MPIAVRCSAELGGTGLVMCDSCLAMVDHGPGCDARFLDRLDTNTGISTGERLLEREAGRVALLRLQGALGRSTAVRRPPVPFDPQGSRSPDHQISMGGNRET